MEDDFDRHLKKALADLPKIDHSEMLWPEIESQLDFEQQLEQRTKELPLHQHRTNLWSEIDKRNKRQNSSKHQKLIYIGSVAATIIILIGFHMFHNYKPDYLISYSVDFEFKTNDISIDLDNDQQINSTLDQLCLYANPVCNHIDFLQRKEELLELEEAILQLNNALDDYGESSSLIKRLIVMENQKTELVLELLSMLKS